MSLQTLLDKYYIIIYKLKRSKHRGKHQIKLTNATTQILANSSNTQTDSHICLQCPFKLLSKFLNFVHLLHFTVLMLETRHTDM